MALNQNDRVVLMKSVVMQNRCSAAVSQYALYLLGGSPTDPQKEWATAALYAPTDMGRRVSEYLINDSNFLAGGSDITDSQLQGSAEAAINNYFITA